MPDERKVDGSSPSMPMHLPFDLFLFFWQWKSDKHGMMLANAALAESATSVFSVCNAVVSCRQAHFWMREHA